jgi:hypothetical protein
MNNNFIGIYENAYTNEFCNRTIEYFNNMQSCGATYNRNFHQKSLKVHIDDEMLFANEEHYVGLDSTKSLFGEFNNEFWNKHYLDYMDKYDVLKQCNPQQIFHYKIQKTQIGGGYHDWHFESASRQLSGRILAWMVYLNDVEDGGETEFLYLHKRIKPKAGTLVIFPASFTHTHRGNPPLSNEKYVITGWVEL